MNCVIKKVKTTQQPLGGSKSLLVFTSQFEDEPIRYCYTFSTEKFERVPQYNYEIWLHYLIPDKKTGSRQQVKVAAIHYYELAEGLDWKEKIQSKEWEKVTRETKMDPSRLEAAVESKLAPLIRDIQNSWTQTAEGRAQKKIKDTLARHQESKKNFEAIWGQGTYEFIFDVFGELKNEAFLHWLQTFNNGSKKNETSASSQYKKSQQKKQKTALKAASYSESEKIWLKKFYRTLAREYHPDSGGETEAMILINKLRDDWRI